MTAPEPPDDTDLPEAAPEPADEGAMLTLILAAIAAYLAAKQVVKGPWRSTALALGLTKVAGNGLSLLAQRSLTRQARDAPRDVAAVLLAQRDPAQRAAVAAGLEHLVRTVYGVQDRMIADAAAGRTSADRPVGRESAGTGADTPAAAPQAARGGTTTAPSAPQPGSDEAADLNPRDLISDSALRRTARDLADIVVQTATTTAIAAAQKLTRGWTKTWTTTGDDRVRASHRDLAGVTIGVLDSFTTPGGQIRYPHDPQAPAGEVIGCRCTLRFTYSRKAQRARTAALVPPDQLVDRDVPAADAAVLADLGRVPVGR